VAVKIKLTRPELKRYRDALARYQRYLPMLKLKQQQLQVTLRDVARQCREAQAAVDQAAARFGRYERVLADYAGIPIRKLAQPEKVKTTTSNVAGVEVPIFADVTFPAAAYSLFGTPAWVDQALLDLREVHRRQARLDVLHEGERLLQRELSRIIQRVNLFEKVKIPEAREAIRIIRIKLGDEMTAAVGRAKIAKSKLAEVMFDERGDARALRGEEENGQ
jgi:V/A-type H+/Na+-transporting ATPase subunit D